MYFTFKRILDLYGFTQFIILMSFQTNILFKYMSQNIMTMTEVFKMCEKCVKKASKFNYIIGEVI